MAKCDHCKASTSEQFSWVLQACANKRRRNVFNLCRACDVELNGLVLRFFNHQKAEKLTSEYAKKTAAKKKARRGDMPVPRVPVPSSDDGRSVRRRGVRR